MCGAWPVRGTSPPERFTSWGWTRAGEDAPYASIGIRAVLEYPDAIRALLGLDPWTAGYADRVRLTYTRGGEPFDYAAGLERTRCTYGGYRMWWGCPRCSRRGGQ
jgi:hypothetical protein